MAIDGKAVCSTHEKQPILSILLALSDVLSILIIREISERILATTNA
ncbi:hypothetical protein [Pseudolactococcus yaeyamensis]